MTSAVNQTKNKPIVLVVVLPLISCVLSSVAGIVIGQLGNLLYSVLGGVADYVSIPGFCGLFLVTAGLSFLSNMLLRKWLIR
jgi:hypothetical protein